MIWRVEVRNRREEELIGRKKRIKISKRKKQTVGLRKQPADQSVTSQSASCKSTTYCVNDYDNKNVWKKTEVPNLLCRFGMTRK